MAGFNTLVRKFKKNREKEKSNASKLLTLRMFHRPTPSEWRANELKKRNFFVYLYQLRLRYTEFHKAKEPPAKTRTIAFKP